MPVIYIDVLLALNLWIDFILLLATARILRLPRRRWRMVLGALLGAATSCLIFLPDLPTAAATAVKLAAELAKRKKNVVLVFTDLTAPSLPAVAAEGKLPEVSVGDLLSAPGMTQERVLKTCVPCEKHPYISFLGYKAGENVFTYAEYSKEKAVDMLVLLRHIPDYVIVDCTSVLTGNVLATAALEVADDVLRVCGCDLKAISYFASYLPLIEDRKFKPEQHIRVLSNTRPYPGGMEYENSFGGVKYRLPYLPIVEEQAATLKLLEPLSGKEAKSYEPVIAAIAVEVFGDGK